MLTRAKLPDLPLWERWPKAALAKKKGTLKKWEKKTGVKWTIKKGKPVKVKHGKGKGKKGGGEESDEE